MANGAGLRRPVPTGPADERQQAWIWCQQELQAAKVARGSPKRHFGCHVTQAACPAVGPTISPSAEIQVKAATSVIAWKTTLPTALPMRQGHRTTKAGRDAIASCVSAAPVRGGQVRAMPLAQAARTRRWRPVCQGRQCPAPFRHAGFESVDRSCRLSKTIGWCGRRCRYVPVNSAWRHRTSWF